MQTEERVKCLGCFEVWTSGDDPACCCDRPAESPRVRLPARPEGMDADTAHLWDEADNYQAQATFADRSDAHDRARDLRQKSVEFRLAAQARLLTAEERERLVALESALSPEVRTALDSYANAEHDCGSARPGSSYTPFWVASKRARIALLELLFVQPHEVHPALFAQLDEEP